MEKYNGAVVQRYIIAKSLACLYKSCLVFLLGILTFILVVEIGSSCFDTGLSPQTSIVANSQQWSRTTFPKTQRRRLDGRGCVRQCGSMDIPYPFGLSQRCAINGFFVLECKEDVSGLNQSTGLYEQGTWPFLTSVVNASASGSSGADLIPYHFSTNSFQVFNITPGKIVVDGTKIKATSCNASVDSQGLRNGQAQISLDPEGPYLIGGGNVVSAIGCSAALGYKTSEGQEAVCGPTSCNNQHYFHFCNYFDCCTLSIAQTLGISIQGGGDCGFGRILLIDSYKTSNPRVIEVGTYGIELEWAIPVNTSVYPALCSAGRNNLTQSPDYACSKTNAACNNVTVSVNSEELLTGYYCTCNTGYSGDGYTNGSSCNDIDECESLSTEGKACAPNANCINTQGSYTCVCPRGWTGDPRRDGTGCTGPNSSNKSTLIIGAVVGVVFLFGMVAGLILCWYYRKKNRHLSRMQILQEMQRQGGATVCKPFTWDELRRATNNFVEQNVVGTGGFGKVHRGTLDDGTEVAVKSVKRDVGGGRDDAKQFINEIGILSMVNHTNLVKLLGCCLETTPPILVCEFITNGSLQDYIRLTQSSGVQTSDGQPLVPKTLDWNQRLKIAIGSAAALTYLHFGISPPIYHRDVKSANILLDRNYVAKVADFGLSKAVPLDSKEIDRSTAIQGTPGYMDIEYLETGQVNTQDKSDVFSFGVVLLELLTAGNAYDSTLQGRDQILARRCRKLMRYSLFEDAIDPTLNASSNKEMQEAIRKVAELAMECTQRQSDQRPTMREVEDRLRSLSPEPTNTRSGTHSWGGETEPKVPFTGDDDTLTYLWDVHAEDLYARALAPFTGEHTFSSSITSGMLTNSEDPGHSKSSGLR